MWVEIPPIVSIPSKRGLHPDRAWRSGRGGFGSVSIPSKRGLHPDQGADLQEADLREVSIPSKRGLHPDKLAPLTLTLATRLNPLKTGPSSRLLRFFSAFCQDQKRRFRAHPRDYGLRDAKWVPWGPEPTHQSSSGQPSGISAHLLRPRRLISTTYPFSWEPLQGARKILFLRMEQPHGGRRVIRLSQISSLPALLQSRRIRNPGGSPDTGGSTLRCRS